MIKTRNVTAIDCRRSGQAILLADYVKNFIRYIYSLLMQTEPQKMKTEQMLIIFLYMAGQEEDYFDSEFLKEEVILEKGRKA